MDIDKLRLLVDVDPSTGVILWRPRTTEMFGDPSIKRIRGACQRFNTIFAGKPALNHKSKGYFKGRIDGFELKAHRVVWAHTKGHWPVGVIDHINRDRGDNRIANLRDATHSQNTLNREITNEDPFIYLNPKPYSGSRTIDGVMYQIKPQKSLDDARLAWMDLERSHINREHWVYLSSEK